MLKNAKSTKKPCIKQIFILYLLGMKTEQKYDTGCSYRSLYYMRVIAGSARRLLLKTIEGMDTRPTTDRIKETLFNMLNTQIPGCTFLDLFAGSGAIGIEALSRGAKQAFFVESNPEAVS